MQTKILLIQVNNSLIINEWGIFDKKIAGFGIQIGLNRKLTKFSIYKIAKALRSKKARSDTINVREGGNLPYTYVGSILKIYKNKKHSSILFRNSLSLINFEISVPIFSPLIRFLFIFKHRNGNKKTTFYLRKHSSVKGKINFNYVLSKYF